MPPRTRKTVAPEADMIEAEPTLGDGADPDVEPEPAAEPAGEVELPCPECFPLGWPDGATSAGCHHGTWLREVAG
jgi:hypothetical protein